MTAWFILKLLHVFFGVLWVGGGVVMVLFIAPAVKASGPAGGQFMGNLAGKYKLPTVLNHSAWTCTIAGVILFWHASSGLNPGYFSTLPGQALTIGAIAGLLAFVGAVFVQLPRSKRIAGLLTAAAGNPDAAQAAEIAAEQQKFKTGGYVVVALFVISLLGMLGSHPV